MFSERAQRIPPPFLPGPLWNRNADDDLEFIYSAAMATLQRGHTPRDENVMGGGTQFFFLIPLNACLEFAFFFSLM